MTHWRSYWLAVPQGEAEADSRVVALSDGNRITIEQCEPNELTIPLRDEMLDSDSPVQVLFKGRRSSLAALIARLK